MVDKIFNKILASTIYKKYRSLMLIILDLIIVNISFMLAYLLKINFDMNNFKSNFWDKLLFLSIFVTLDYGIYFYCYKINKSLWTYISAKEIFSIIKAIFFASLTFEIFIYLFYRQVDIITAIMISSALILIMMLGVRVVYRALREYCYQEVGANGHRKNAIIVGAGDSGYILLKGITKHKYYKSKVIGFLDDNKVGSVVSGVPVIGVLGDISDVVARNDVRMVFIAIPRLSIDKKRFLIEALKPFQCEIKIIRNSVDLLEVDEDTIASKMKDIAIEDLLGRGEVKLEQSEITEYIQGKKVLVTGAGGTIGGQLSREIFNYHPAILYLLDINENGLYMLEQDFLRYKRENPKYENIQVVSEVLSIRDDKALDYFIGNSKPDVVYHAAAHKHVPLMETRPMEAVKNNIIGTRNLIDISIKHQVERLIMISTDKAVNPTTAMGATKRMTELILQSRKNNGVTKLAAVRFGNVLGSNGSVIPIFRKQLQAGGPLTITNKGIVRYFMTVPEAAQLVLQAGFYADKGEIFVLDMGQPVRILDLAENMIRLSGFTPYKDIDIVEIGLRPGEKMYEELSWNDENTEKTKNDLIFKNNVQDVDAVKLNKVIDDLYEKAVSNISSKDMKAEIMKSIHNEY